MVSQKAVKTGATIGAGVVGAGLGATFVPQLVNVSDPTLRTLVQVGGTLVGATAGVVALWLLWPAASHGA